MRPMTFSSSGQQYPTWLDGRDHEKYDAAKDNEEDIS